MGPKVLEMLNWPATPTPLRLSRAAKFISTGPGNKITVLERHRTKPTKSSPTTSAS